MTVPIDGQYIPTAASKRRKEARIVGVVELTSGSASAAAEPRKTYVSSTSAL